jgi:hypothetical protein
LFVSNIRFFSHWNHPRVVAAAAKRKLSHSCTVSVSSYSCGTRSQSSRCTLSNHASSAYRRTATRAKSSAKFGSLKLALIGPGQVGGGNGGRMKEGGGGGGGEMRRESGGIHFRPKQQYRLQWRQHCRQAIAPFTMSSLSPRPIRRYMPAASCSSIRAVIAHEVIIIAWCYAHMHRILLTDYTLCLLRTTNRLYSVLTSYY